MNIKIKMIDIVDNFFGISKLPLIKPMGNGEIILKKSLRKSIQNNILLNNQIIVILLICFWLWIVEYAWKRMI